MTSNENEIDKSTEQDSGKSWIEIVNLILMVAIIAMAAGITLYALIRVPVLKELFSALAVELPLLTKLTVQYYTVAAAGLIAAVNVVTTFTIKPKRALVVSLVCFAFLFINVWFIYHAIELPIEKLQQQLGE